MLRKIPQTFKKSIYDYELVKRSKKVALYKQLRSGVTYAFEVHKLRLNPSDTTKYVNPDGTIKVVERPDRETLASNEEFGRDGWSYDTLGDALVKWEELLKWEKKKF